MATESNMNIIDTKDEGIVVKEIPISISDEKLRNSLSCAYEESLLYSNEVELWHKRFCITRQSTFKIVLG